MTSIGVEKPKKFVRGHDARYKDLSTDTPGPNAPAYCAESERQGLCDVGSGIGFVGTRTVNEATHELAQLGKYWCVNTCRQFEDLTAPTCNNVFKFAEEWHIKYVEGKDFLYLYRGDVSRSNDDRTPPSGYQTRANLQEIKLIPVRYMCDRTNTHNMTSAQDARKSQGTRNGSQ